MHALLDQTVKKSASNTYSDVSIGANVYKINKGDTADGATCNEVKVAVVVEANSRKSISYSLTGPIGSIDYWNWMPRDTCDHVISYNQLGDNNGWWVRVDDSARNAWCINYYGVWYDRIWITTNGFVSFDPSACNTTDNRWTKPTPVALGNSATPNAIVAPLWRDLYFDSSSKIVYGKTTGPSSVDYQGKTFMIQWTNMLNKADNKRQTFAVFITEFFMWNTYSSRIDFVYWQYTKVAGTTIGIEDQYGGRGVSLTPSDTDGGFNDKYCYFKPSLWPAIDHIYLYAKKEGNADLQNIEVKGLSDIYPAGTNLQGLRNDPANDYSKMGAVVGAADLLIQGLGMLPILPGPVLAGFTAYSVISTGVQLAALLTPTEPTNRVTPSPRGSTVTATALNSAQDEMTGYGFAWDVALFAALDWHIFSESYNNAITIWAEVVCRDQFGNHLSPSLVTPSTIHQGITLTMKAKDPYAGPYGWLGRTNPDGHAYNFYTFLNSYGRGYHIDSSPNQGDSGYKMMGWTSLVDDPAYDHKVRPDGTIRVEGYFYQYDTLPSSLQSTGRKTFLYFLNAPSLASTYNRELNTVISSVQILQPSEFNTWVFKGVSYNLGTAWANKPVKVAIGREDTTTGSYSLQADWAGIKTLIVRQGYSDQMTWASIFANQTYALSISVGSGTNTGTVHRTGVNGEYFYTPQTYSWPLSSGSSVQLQAYPAPGYKFSHWELDGPWMFSNPIPLVGNGDHTLKAFFTPANQAVVTIVSGAYGTTSPSPGTYSYTITSPPGTLSVSAGPISGFLFDYWTWGTSSGSSGTSTTNPYVVTLNADWYLYAKFKQKPSGCIAKGTLVTLADGSEVAVEDVKKGDHVLGYDVQRNEFVVETVLDVASTNVPGIVVINEGLLRVTPTEQPIYVKMGEVTGWIRDPEDIQVGWQVYDPLTSTWVTVSSVTYSLEKTRVFDFITDGPKTYLANSILLMDKPVPI